LRNRVLQRAFERLELHDGKLSRAVLRGLRHEVVFGRVTTERQIRT